MSHPPLESLLAHSDWIRAFASSLVLDPARAEDVVQETWLRALESPPQTKDSPRGWLATVARNTARNFARSETRRDRRERETARSDVQPDTRELLERAALQRDLVDELMKLDEPYRETLLLRYYEGLPPREVARRLERPVNTVRTHVQRGLERLREKLDEEHEGREAWCLAFLPLAHRTGTAAAHGSLITSIGGIAMLLKIALPFGLLALATGLWLDGPDDVEGLSPSELVVDSDPVEIESDSGPSTSAGERDERTELAAAESTGSTTETEDAAVSVSVHGRAVGIDGAPLAGITFVWVPPLPFGARASQESPRGTSAGDGTFVVETSGGPGELKLDSDTLHLLTVGHAALREDLGRLFVVVPTVDVAGVAVDERGEPIAGAEISVRSSSDAPPGFPYLLVANDTPISVKKTVTDDEGRFRLDNVPSFQESRIEGSTRGANTAVETPRISRDDLRLVLESRSDRHVLSGEVRTPDGLACANASVYFLSESTRTDDSGRFEIELFDSGPHENAKLVAWKIGFQPAMVEGLPARWADDAGAGTDLVLVLGEEPLAITGRVLDHAGRPLREFHVDIIDGTPFETSDSFVETRLAGKLGGMNLSPGTGDDGTFTVGGLADRSYRLRAYHKDSLLTLESAPIPAGTKDVELRFGSDPTFALVTGRVVDRHDRAVEGVTVRTSLTRFANDLGMSASIGGNQETTTDEHGKFALKNVPREHVDLVVTSPFIEYSTFAPPQEPSGLRLEIVRLLHFQLRVGTVEKGQQAEIVDAQGEIVTMRVLRPSATTWTNRIRLDAKTSPTFKVPDSANEIVIRDADRREVRRIAIVPSGDPRELQILSL